jgi:L-threonylcarbamoyladenylate synthase
LFVAVPMTIVAQSLGSKYLLDAKALDRIRGVLGEGGLVVFPTDTVYGLAADPFQDPAVARLYEAKVRPPGTPVSMAVADQTEIFRFGQRTAIGEAFCAKNLPGPYTVVLAATPEAPHSLVSKEGRIALRIPAHPIPRLLSKAYGPITATSANVHGRRSPVTCAEAEEQLGDRVDLYVDGGPTPLGGESTVVDLSGERAKILRQGVLPRGA